MSEEIVILFPNTTTWRPLLMMIIGLCMLPFPHTAAALQIGTATANEVQPATEPDRDAESTPLTPEEQQRRRNVLSVGWIMLIGVALLGGLLLIIVLTLGASVKRVARSPSPDAPLRDPYWYLKQKPQSDSNPNHE